VVVPVAKKRVEDPSVPKITATTDVVELVAHLDDPEGDPVETLEKIRERLARWTTVRKGVDGSASLRVKRVSPPELRKTCGDLPIDVHSPFDWSQVPLTFGADGIYYFRVYWQNKRIAQLGFKEFPEYRATNLIQAPAAQPAQPEPIQVTGNRDQLLIQLVSQITQRQQESNDAVLEAIKSNTETMRAFLQHGLQKSKPEGILDQLDQVATVAEKIKKFQKAFGVSTDGDRATDWSALAREVIDEYGEDVISGIFALLAQRKQGQQPTDDDTPDEVEGTIIELPDAGKGNGE